METEYYIEKDGQVFLVDHHGRLCFPKKHEVTIPFEEVAAMPISKKDVRFCLAKIKHFPTDWTPKDDVPGMENVDRTVRIAVNRSLVRHVVDGVIVKDGKLLIVKNARGFTKDKWDLPGGFITYPDSPATSLIREVKEETGLDVKPRKLFHVGTGTSELANMYFISFFYVCDVAGGDLMPDPDEISAVEWVDLETAIERTEGFIRDALEVYRKQ